MALNIYAVATPRWHARGEALVAYADHPDLQPPLRDRELKDDPAYLRSMKPEADTRYLQIIGNMDYWLPPHHPHQYVAVVTGG
jgi:hypothetical protein